jgi:hypothetical protein
VHNFGDDSYTPTVTHLETCQLARTLLHGLS